MPTFSTPASNLAVVIGILVAMAGMSLWFQIQWMYPLVFAIAIVWYAKATAQLKIHRRDAPDAAIVAEHIVVMGVASLIVHVALAGLGLKASWAMTGQFTPDSVWVAAESFSEGLVCSAVAPLVAMWTRTSHASRGDDSPETQGADAQKLKDSAPLDDQAPQRMAALALRAAEDFEQANRRLVEAADQAATDLRRASGVAVAALDAVATTVGPSITALASSLDDFTMSVQRQCNGIGVAMVELIAGLTNSGAPVKESLAKLAAEIGSSARPLGAGFQMLAADIDVQGKRITSGLESAAGRLEQGFAGIGRTSDALALKLATLEASIAGLSATSGKLASDLPAAFGTLSGGAHDLRVEMDELARRLKEGGQLLQGLQDLIHSVRRFIEPETANSGRDVAEQSPMRVS